MNIVSKRGHGAVSELIYWVSGRQYTHASIGIGEQTDCFYSYDYRGFRTEHPAHRKLYNHRRESLCYQFMVTQKEYDKVQSAIEKSKG